MKIIFKNSELNEGIINVSLDGGFTYKNYEITDVKDSGIPLDDSQDYEKIKIKGPANIIKRLDVVSDIPTNVKVTEGLNFIMDTDTYGFSFPECVVGVTLPDGITSITKSLTNSSYSTENVFSKFPNLHSIIIPDGVTSIDDYAFNCTSLTSIDIPSSVTSIGNDAFYNCFGLTSVIIQEGVTKIGDDAFYMCSKLTNVTIPSSITEFGDNAFFGCLSLTSIDIPSSVTSIGSGAFGGCKSLTSIKVDENNQNYSTSEDEKVLFNKDKTTLVCYPSANGDYAIPNSVTKIDNYAFHKCSSLTGVTIPDSVTSIGKMAFYNCGLASITIPSSVTTIGDIAFSDCTSLTSVIIQKGVTKIGYQTFDTCMNLASVTIPDSVTSIGDKAFYYCKSLKTINYTGTEDQWNAISKGTDWNKSSLRHGNQLQLPKLSRNNWNRRSKRDFLA